MTRALRIGISSNLFHVDPARPVYKGKTLSYVEESMPRWVQGAGAIPYILPRLSGGVKAKDTIAPLDAILFSGGADIAPKSYGQEPLRPEWAGDYERDQYEIELFHAAREAGKPVLGICRGHQLINVALGGTMFQDIQTQNPHAQLHRSWDVYDELKHEIDIAPGSVLHAIFPGRGRGLINSIHHQAVDKIGAGLRAQAHSVPDNIVESLWLEEPGAYVLGVQWHPEWRRDPDILDSAAILGHFLEAAARRR